MITYASPSDFDLFINNINGAKNALSSGAGGDGDERDGDEHLHTTLPRDVAATDILLGPRNWTAKQEMNQVPYPVKEYQSDLEMNERMHELLYYNESLRDDDGLYSTLHSMHHHIPPDSRVYPLANTHGEVSVAGHPHKSTH